MRIGGPAHTLGARRDGPMYETHRGLWRAPWRRGWRRTVPHVQSSDRSPTGADLPQLGPRSAYRFHQWQANLRILDMEAIKTVPYVPLSHPFVERLIGTIRRECLDRTLFWTAADLEMKLLDFQRYYNGHRTHAGLNGRTPKPCTDTICARASISSYRWQPHRRGLYQTPMGGVNL